MSLILDQGVRQEVLPLVESTISLCTYTLAHQRIPSTLKSDGQRRKCSKSQDTAILPSIDSDLIKDL